MNSRVARRTDALTPTRIFEAAIAILDAEGRGPSSVGLTLRTLMAQLSTGAGAIYHHVANMDELRAAAADEVLRGPLGDAIGTADPVEAVRGVAAAIFDAFDAHPWLGGQLARDPVQPAVLRIWKTVGSQLRRLDVASLTDAGSTLTSFILGAAAQHAAGTAQLPEGVDRADYLAQVAERVREFDPDPLMNDIATDVAVHDDREQFLAGIDIVLRGIQH